jgi:hypothetical protein
MLDRPSRRAQWQRRYRQRQRDGNVVTEVPASMIELLIAGEWLKLIEATDRRAITQAMDAMAKATLKNR